MNTTEHGVDTSGSYYTAARDRDGNVRMNGGYSLMVATADHTLTDVSVWFENSRPGRYREQYRSALRLMRAEQGEPDERPIHRDEQPDYVTPVCGHRTVARNMDGGWICTDEPSCHVRFAIAEGGAA